MDAMRNSRIVRVHMKNVSHSLHDRLLTTRHRVGDHDGRGGSTKTAVPEVFRTATATVARYVGAENTRVCRKTWLASGVVQRFNAVRGSSHE